MTNFFNTPYFEERPWGRFIKFTENEKTTVKIITVKAGEAFSLQYHNHRSEFWHIISGGGTAYIGNNKVEIVPGKDILITEKTSHRVHAGKNDVIFLEISLGEFDENDITRLQDDYGRV